MNQFSLNDQFDVGMQELILEDPVFTVGSLVKIFDAHDTLKTKAFDVGVVKNKLTNSGWFIVLVGDRTQLAHMGWMEIA